MSGAIRSSDGATVGPDIPGRIEPRSLPPWVDWLFWGGCALTVALWFLASSFRSPVLVIDTVFDSICLAGATLALRYVRRIGSAPIEIGWRLFIWGLLIRLLDTLTVQPNIPNTIASLLEDGPATIAVVAIVWGFFRYRQTRRGEIETLAYQLKFQHLAGELSRNIVGTPAADLDRQIGLALERIADTYALDRVNVCWFDEDNSTASPSHSWGRNGPPPPLLKPVDVPWLWSQVLQGKAVLFERPDQLPAEAASDKGTIVKLGIKSFLCPRLKVGETLLGACAFATVNEYRQWSERQVQELTILAEIIASAAARARAHQKLLLRESEISGQLQFQRLAAELSSAFLKTPESDIDRQVNLALEKIADAYQLDRISAWWFDREADASRLTHVWFRSGLPPPAVLAGADLPWLRAQGFAGETVVIESVDQLPEHAASEREYMARVGIQSLLAIPYMVGRTRLAACAFSTVRQQRSWTAPHVAQLRFLGEIIVTAVVRARTDHALLQRDEELAHAQRIAHVGSYAFLPSSEETHFSDELCSILGCEPQDASLDSLLSCIHVDDRQRVADAVQHAMMRETQFEQEYRLVRPDGSERNVHHRGEVERDASGKVLRALGTILDITERKQSEQALNHALSQLETLTNHLEAENLYLRDEVRTTHGFDKIVGESLALKRCLRQVEQVASTDSTVLILGETGTGKELIAHSIHDLSRRKNGPMVSVNCAALQPTLIEAELFGHERGAFTGAQSRRLGRFEIADGGTLFLDEIGDLPLDLQSKLLRVLQEGEFERVGGTQKIRADVRVIAATNRDLEQAVERGSFRADLFYRLNVFPIALPPLRERKQDIPLLVEHFVGKHARRLGRDIDSVSGRMLERLAAQPWPGNVRELENWILRAVVTSEGPMLDLDVGEQQLRPRQPDPSSAGGSKGSQLRDVESRHILKVLEETGWVIEGERGAASRLGLNPSTLRSRMRKLGIKRSGPRSHSKSASQ